MNQPSKPALEAARQILDQNSRLPVGLPDERAAGIIDSALEGERELSRQLAQRLRSAMACLWTICLLLPAEQVREIKPELDAIDAQADEVLTAYEQACGEERTP